MKEPEGGCHEMLAFGHGYCTRELSAAGITHTVNKIKINGHSSRQHLLDSVP